MDVKSVLDKSIEDFAKETQDKVTSLEPITEIPTECHPKEHHFVSMDNIRDEMMCTKCLRKAKTNTMPMQRNENSTITRQIQSAINNRN